MKDPMNFCSITKATNAEFPEITEVWEASVRATHHFLKEDDILFFKPLIQNEFLHALNVYIIRDGNAAITGFLGTAGNKLEMLFIHPASRGQGIGQTLLKYAVDQLGVYQVDVNEQNSQAVGFYQHFGFSITGRSERDGMGKPYPLLHMELSR